MESGDKPPQLHGQTLAFSRAQAIAILVGMGAGILIWFLFPPEHYPNVACGTLESPGDGRNCPAGAALFTFMACLFVGAVLGLAIEAVARWIGSRIVRDDI
jgi:hypothetical protein